LRFKELPASLLPKSEPVNGDAAETAGEEGQGSLASVVARWRGVTARARSEAKEPPDSTRLTSELLSSPVASSLLRRPGSNLSG
jgi:hypothetical protein